jgi:squalene synthase HpnC
MKYIFPSGLEPAYRECLRLAQSHYENFPVASWLLPVESRPHVAALYAFARAADDFADEETYEGKRLLALNRWGKGLQNAMRGEKAPSVLQAFAHTIKTMRIPLSLPLDLLKAYRMDLRIHRYPTWDSLLYYCRHSANPVGRMVLYISGIREETIHRYSDYICSGLQLINFWQDTAIDLNRDRIYYPKSEWEKAGLGERNLLISKDSENTRHLVKNAVDFTENYYRRGYPLLSAVRGRLKLELKATYLGGQGILNKIRGINYNVFENRPILKPLDKTLLVLKALAGLVKD